MSCSLFDYMSTDGAIHASGVYIHMDTQTQGGVKKPESTSNCSLKRET